MFRRSPGRYRWRTRARLGLPRWFAILLPRGKKDCGSHEFYTDRRGIVRCFHCRTADHPNRQWIVRAGGAGSPPVAPPSKGRPRGRGGKGGVREPRRPRTPSGSTGEALPME